MIGVIVSHVFLFDPWASRWAAQFFAPAWWFVPAILIGYLTYPAVRAVSRVWNGALLLAISAGITIISYRAVDTGVLFNEIWYYVVLQESFNFSLGVVLANWWLGGKQSTIDRLVGDPRTLAVAFVVFVVGNIANWTPQLRPVASMFYGPSLVVIVAFLGKQLERRPLGRALSAYDSYDLYLVHQPFAYPIALVAKLFFHAYAIFAGWFIFIAVAAGAARLLSFVPDFRSPQPHEAPAPPRQAAESDEFDLRQGTTSATPSQ
jgi:hypothetical protein